MLFTRGTKSGETTQRSAHESFDARPGNQTEWELDRALELGWGKIAQHCWPNIIVSTHDFFVFI